MLYDPTSEQRLKGRAQLSNARRMVEMRTEYKLRRALPVRVYKGVA